jgi:extradiol dioxygenase family protein
MNKTTPFHLAIPVQNLQKCRAFYSNVLGCVEGRSSEKWVDFNFFGHQLVIHQTDIVQPKNATNPVDGKQVPIPHFGVVLEWALWEELSEKLQSQKIDFIIAPYIRFKGEVGEQATMFFLDPEENALEFKSFKDRSKIFEK